MTEQIPLYRSRYPDFDVLRRADEWDEVTRELVLRRVREVPPLRFLREDESATLAAFAAVALPQSDRPPEARVPIVPELDARLHAKESGGWRIESLPPDPELWRAFAAALDDEARLAGAPGPFAELSDDLRARIVSRIRASAVRAAIADESWTDIGTPPLLVDEEGRWRVPEPTDEPLASPLWERIPPRWTLPLVLFEIVSHYYGHPYAWSEIGFAGPMFPGIYPRTSRDNPSEAQEASGDRLRRLLDVGADRTPAGADDGAARAGSGTRRGVPTRVLGLRQLDMAEVVRENDARVRHDSADKDVDVCIVGSGAGGAVLAAKLAEAGLSVVVLEAGPFWVPQRDFVSDEKGAERLYWRDTRIVGGHDPIQLGGNVTGKGVGGSTVHHTMVKLRFHPADFRARSRDGVGDDWPIRYEDLEPYYDEVEDALGIAGPSRFPWGAFHGPFPQRAHPATSQASVLLTGCEALGWRATMAPIATLSSPKDGRPPCTYRGFCVYGCKPNAKSSELVTFIPRAVHAGAVIKHGAMVARLNTANGRVTSAVYLHGGRRYEQRARTFFVCGYAIETPRLLLQSANDEFPRGLANSSGLVGKRLMTHLTHGAFARFDDLKRPYKGPPNFTVTQDHYGSDPDRGFARGFTLMSVGALPIAFSRLLVAGTLEWGRALRERMLDYNHYAGVNMNAECLPYEHNEVRLGAETDHHGLPVPVVRFSVGENEKRMVRYARERVAEVLRAAGGRRMFFFPDTAHLMGTCRMGDDPRTSVVDAWGRSHDVPNLFVMDGSVFVTSSGVNPSLTIEALAARTADAFARWRE